MAVEELKRVYGTPPLRQGEETMQRRQARKRKTEGKKKQKNEQRQVQKVDLRI